MLPNSQSLFEMAGKSKWKTWIERGLALFLGAILVWLIVLMVQIRAYADVRDDDPADTAIVLGAAVWQDEPSPVFAARIDHAIDLYHARRVKALIFTGGVGLDDVRAESEVARTYALARGVLAADIFYETNSHITYTNLEQAYSIVEQEGFRRVLIVSDPLHMKRALTIAHDVGLDAYPSPTPTTRYITWKSKLGFLLRETYFYAGYLIKKPFHCQQAD